MKLNQVIAIVGGKKAAVSKNLTELYHKLQKSNLFEGLHKTYTPREDGEVGQPPQRKNPEYRVSELYGKIEGELAEMFDAVATQDYANCYARADVVVDGQVLFEQVPVTYMLFLEKRLEELKAFASAVPVRDPAEEWKYNPESNLFVTDAVRTNSTSKVQEAIVLYDATPNHPAQTQLIQKDKVIGFWDSRKFSGASTEQEKGELLSKIVKLAEAVKLAREEANSVEVEKKQIGQKLLDFVFGGSSLKKQTAAFTGR